MNGEDGHAILSSTCFQLGVTGSQITQSFSRRIEHIGLSHKQVGLLAVVDAGVATSQREIATQLHVAPSLVVTLVDQLTSAGAVRRTRSRSDRRVQTIEITDEGRRLLKAATDVASRLDADRALVRPRHGRPHRHHDRPGRLHPPRPAHLTTEDGATVATG